MYVPSSTIDCNRHHQTAIKQLHSAEGCLDSVPYNFSKAIIKKFIISQAIFSARTTAAAAETERVGLVQLYCRSKK